MTHHDDTTAQRTRRLSECASRCSREAHSATSWAPCRDVVTVSRGGFVAALVALLLVFLLIGVGLVFFSVSRETGRGLHREVDILRARSLARAGLQRALLVIRRQYEGRNFSWQYPRQTRPAVDEDELEGKLAGGRFKVLGVEPLKFRRGDRWIGPYRNRPYVVRGEPLGYYSIYRIESEGRVDRTGTRVVMSSLVKVIRRRVVTQ